MKFYRVVCLLLLVLFLINFFMFNRPSDTVKVSSQLNKSQRNHFIRLLSDAHFLTPNLKDVADSLIESEFNPPVEWGENVTGVVTKLQTDERVIALTFDACGGPYGSGYDKELIQFLIEEEIRATLFFNYRWIQENMDEFLFLANLDQFQIANHVTEHRPLSVNGKIAWGISGTNSFAEVIDEVLINYELVKELTGIEMRHFRSGTAFMTKWLLKSFNN